MEFRFLHWKSWILGGALYFLIDITKLLLQSKLQIAPTPGTGARHLRVCPNLVLSTSCPTLGAQRSEVHSQAISTLVSVMHPFFLSSKALRCNSLAIKVNKSMPFGIFIKLSKCYHYLIPKHVCHPQKTPIRIQFLLYFPSPHWTIFLICAFAYSTNGII